MSGWKMSNEQRANLRYAQRLVSPDCCHRCDDEFDTRVESIVNEALAELRESIAAEIEATAHEGGITHRRYCVPKAAAIARGESA